MSAPRTGGTRLAWAVALGAVATAVTLPAGAEPTATLIAFEAGQPIRAADFNANFKTLRDATNDLDARVGAPSQLATVDRSNVVAAINELDARLGARSQLATVDSSNVVAAINELAARPSGGNGATRMRARIEWYDYRGEGAVLADFRRIGANPHGREVAGRPFTLRFAAQALQGTAAATPQISGDIVARLEWTFNHGGIGQRTVTQTERFTFSLSSSAAGVVTMTGTVPDVPVFGVDVTEGEECWARLVIESKTLVVGSAAYVYGSAQLLIAD